MQLGNNLLPVNLRRNHCILAALYNIFDFVQLLRWYYFPKFWSTVLGPACFGATILLLALAIFTFNRVKVNRFFLYYAEGKDNHGVVEDHHAEVEQLCYKDILKRSWTYLLSGYLTYCTTLCLFPAVTSTG